MSCLTSPTALQLTLCSGKATYLAQTCNRGRKSVSSFKAPQGKRQDWNLQLFKRSCSA